MLDIKNYEGKYPEATERTIATCIKHINSAIRKKNVPQLEDLQTRITLYTKHAHKEATEVWTEMYNYIEVAKENIIKRQSGEFTISRYLTKLKATYELSTNEIVRSTHLPRNMVESILTKSDDYRRPWQETQRIVMDMSSRWGTPQAVQSEWDKFIERIILPNNKLLVMYWDDMHEDMDYMRIGTLIKEFRNRKNLTQDVPGIAQANFADIENGKRPVTYPRLEQICDYLGFTMDEFLTELKKRDTLIRKVVPIHIRMKEARERAGVSIDEFVKQTQCKYRVRSVEQMEACGAGLNVNFIHAYVKYADLDLEQIVREYQNGPEPYATLVNNCLGQYDDDEEDKTLRKNIITLEQYLADKEQIVIHGKTIPGKFMSIMLQMMYYGNTENDYEKMIEYMEMVQNNESPEILKMSQDEAITYKRQLASRYKKKMDSMKLPRDKREKIIPIYNRLMLKRARYLFTTYAKQLTDAIDEPFYPLAECNTVFFINQRLLKVDFDTFIKESLTWKLESKHIPYYEILNFFYEIVDADTPEKRSKVIDNIKTFQGKYKL